MLIIPEKWICKPDHGQDGFLQAWADCGYAGVPIPMETHGVAPEDVTLDRAQEFDFITECGGDYDVFSDEADFLRRRGQRYAPESFVPCGLLPPHRGSPSPQAIINGRVKETVSDPTERGFAKDDAVFVVTCLGYEFDAVVPASVARGKKPQVGNLVSGLYRIQGRPALAG